MLSDLASAHNRDRRGLRLTVFSIDLALSFLAVDGREEEVDTGRSRVLDEKREFVDEAEVVTERAAVEYTRD